MTIYNWSAIAPGTNLGTLTTADVINFDTGSTPLDTVVSWDAAGLVQLSATGKGASFTITGGGRALTDANFTFTNPVAGKILIGDNTASIGNGTSTFDDADNTLDNSAAGAKNDRLLGLNGNDTMLGGAGDDILVVGNGGNPWGNDSVNGGSGFNDFIALGTLSTTGAVIDFNDHTLSNAQGLASFSGIENALGGSGDDQFYAFEASRAYIGRFYNPGGGPIDFTRVMEGFGGNDVFVGDQRDGLNDRVRFFGSPNGVYVNLAEEYALDGWDSNSTLAGVQSYTDTLRFIDDIQASPFNDTLLGGGLGTTGGGFFNEQFEGMAGNDLIDGNGGQNISFAYFSSPAGVTVNLSTGTASDGFGGTDTLIGGTVSSAINGSNFADSLTGDDTRTFLQGRGGNDTLDGRGGLDTAIFFYFQSPDTLNGVGVNVDLANATVDLSAFGLGIDTLISIEGLRGGDLNDTLRGQNNVDNELDGRAGADLLDGRSGNDRVRYDASPNAVNVNLGTGTATDGFGSTDTLTSIENVRGSRLGDTIVGSTANNGIEGFLGADSMNGGGGTGDTLEFRFSPGGVVVNLAAATPAQVVAEDGWGFADKYAANFENVVGGAGDDLITGSDVANRLDGNIGADTLAGGLGNDTFGVDSDGDTLSDTGGTDTVESLIDWTLATGFENLTLLEPTAGPTVNPLGSSPATRAIGNSVKNVIIGNSAANFIDGGGGADDMRGGKGNDTYIVAQSTDLVKENPNEGVDTVKASVSYILAANVENLVQTGTGAIDGTGNDRANSIKGNAGANDLDGGGGNDSLDGGAGIDNLTGGAGNDTFIWDATDTLVDGGAGSQDRIVVKGAATTLNLNALNGTLINDVEVFDIHGAGNNTLSVSAATAEAMGGDLTVFGNAGDKVNLNGTGVWTENTGVDISYQGHIFHAWSNDLNNAEVLIEVGVTVVDAP